MNIIKPDWNVFKTKFSENPQNNFEWLCYLLFCEEFSRPCGIFRYKNQSRIETDPIIDEDKVIGWQAKFYKTTLSKHKDDIIEAIAKSRTDYSDITKIIFYTNQEWGQGKNGNDPQAKIDAEKAANDFNIIIEWRTASFFEATFVAIQNKIIGQHFFVLGESMISMLEKKKRHTEIVLFDIQSEIEFNCQKIRIDRNKILQEIDHALDEKQIIILSGKGGVGKTAVIKNLYEKNEGLIPFYVFKSNEFEIKNVSELFSEYSLCEFLDAHKDENNKIIVIDSAEKLLELKYTDPFKEFLIETIKRNWKIIFTTRSSYLENLNYEFLEIHKIIPLNLDIQNIDQHELEDLSETYRFLLPKDQKLLELIKTPFYLNEYLRFYIKDEDIDYFGFKQKIWNQTIKKTNPAREQCFMQIALQRAQQSQFFINPSLDRQVLRELVNDGVLGYEIAGYFITHDIYEEWALEKIIESEFIRKNNNIQIFNNIGSSLPIRRCFRNWLSEKLSLNDNNIKQFIETVIFDEAIDSFWKDEVFVSVLLSDYADTFFEQFKENLLADESKTIEKISFLLRIACKEVDDYFFSSLGIKNVNWISEKYVFTKPKGDGWHWFIHFIFQYFDTIGIKNFHYILPIIHDWNSKCRHGETVRFSSIVALKYYQWAIKNDGLFLLEEKDKENIIQTILFGAAELKDDLKSIFNEVIKNRWKRYGDPYYDLIKSILTSYGENIEVLKAYPDQVLLLADLFWNKTPKKTETFNDYSIGIERDFDIEENLTWYSPPSAFQTPVYWLLQYSFKKTLDFILAFTNKKVEFFANSVQGKRELKEIDIVIEEGKISTQYIGNRLWCTYRGTQSSPYVLESMHMALEKYFLERAKKLDPQVIEEWLLYLLANTKSASITAIIVSIVLFVPEKTFNIAKILFQTKEFFLYDTSRMTLDYSANSLFGIGYGINYSDKIYQDERIKTCNDEHRKKTLENIALYYQFFRNEETTNEEVKTRQDTIWDIFDKYYSRLSKKKVENESDKTWRLYLVRMDKRKMQPTAEEDDGKIIINFNPEIDPDLCAYSDAAIKETYELSKYTSLLLWAKGKMDNYVAEKDYKQYEDTGIVIKEVKEVIKGLEESSDEKFRLLNHTIPGYACSVLVKDTFKSLSKEDKLFCKKVIISIASSALHENYRYQIFDGVEAAIFVLPILLHEYPEEKVAIKSILLLTLFDSHSIGAYGNYCDYSSKTIINNLWKLSFDDAQSLLLGYLLLRPQYNELKFEMNEQYYKKKRELHENDVINAFRKKHKADIQKVIENKVYFSDLQNLEGYKLDDLVMPFELIPDNLDKEEYKNLAQLIICIFAKNLLSSENERKVDYVVKTKFINKLVILILSLPLIDISDYASPFIVNYSKSEVLADIFKAFIIAEDRMCVCDKFWTVWSLFENKIVEMCADGESYYDTKEIIESYLFAQTPWKETSVGWHTLKKDNKIFFKRISESIGRCPSALYSISKLLNGIGTIYLEDGIFWISNMLKENKNLYTDSLENDTVFFMENLTKKYIFLNREKIRTTKQVKGDILVILDFLIKKTSAIGYMLRESVL